MTSASSSISNGTTCGLHCASRKTLKAASKDKRTENALIPDSTDRWRGTPLTMHPQKKAARTRHQMPNTWGAQADMARNNSSANKKEFQSLEPKWLRKNSPRKQTQTKTKSFKKNKI
jgi:hypothetical protein